MTQNLNLAKALYNTLAYADIFDYPLRHEEIREWIILEKSALSLPKNLEKNLQVLLIKKIIGKKGEFYYLKGRVKIIKTRLEREKWSKPKIIIAENIAVILRKIPWIKLIGITGGVARLNAKKEDDIDLFFIITKNRLWLTRIIIVLVLKTLGRYRRPDKFANMICPNMFVSETVLGMKPQDLYTAHEICLMKTLYVKDNLDVRFYQNNSWIKKFLPNKYFILNKQKKSLSKQPIKYWSKTISLFWDFLEKEVRQWQLHYMRQKKTTEIVSESLIKFHPRDMRKTVLTLYADRLENWH